VGGSMRDGPTCQARASRMSRRAIIAKPRETARLAVCFGSPRTFAHDRQEGTERLRPHRSLRQLLCGPPQSCIKMSAQFGKEDIIAARTADEHTVGPPDTRTWQSRAPECAAPALHA